MGLPVLDPPTAAEDGRDGRDVESTAPTATDAAADGTAARPPPRGRRRRRAAYACLAAAAVLAVGGLRGSAGVRGGARRRLTVGGYEMGLSWFNGEDRRTRSGVVPSMTCPRGKYRPTNGADDNYHRLVSLRVDGCRDCPRGRYGAVAGLTTEYCSADCPMGTYRDRTGGKGVIDCHACPPGRYGQKAGLVTKFCSAPCAPGKYSTVFGLDDPQKCKECPVGARFSQCTWELKAQHFSGDRVHHYDLDTRPADKLRSEPVRFSKPEDDAGKDPARPLDLTLPFLLPLRNTLPSDD